MVEPVVELKHGKLIFHFKNYLFAELKVSATVIFLDFNKCCLE